MPCHAMSFITIHNDAYTTSLKFIKFNIININFTVVSQVSTHGRLNILAHMDTYLGYNIHMFV